MNPVLEELFATGLTTTPNKGEISISDSVSPDEAAFLSQIVSETSPSVTLEVGLAMGMSALAICDALPRTPSSRHIVIDPFQNCRPKWGGIGLHNLRRAGFEHLVEFHELPSHRVLPQLEATGRMIDFAFIDGCHTFDYAFVDFFYIDKMLPVGGIVAFDDADWPSVRRVIRYFVTNLDYSVYRTLPKEAISRSPERRVYEGCLSIGSAILNSCRRIPGLDKPITRAFGAELLGIDKKYGLIGSCIALRKDGEDDRNVDYHMEF
jgi:predicted O-methyltransferase YrrM